MMEPLPFRVQRNTVGKEETATIGTVPQAAGNPGKPGDESGVEGVLEQDGKVEFSRAKFRRQGNPPRESGMAPLAVVHYHLINRVMVGKEFGDERIGQDGDMRVGKRFPHRSEGRSRHDGITKPVHGTNQD
jgi:hypothetical protein